MSMKDDDMDLTEMNETGEQRIFVRKPVVPFVTAPRTVALAMPPGYAEAIAAAVAKSEQGNETMVLGPIAPGPALPFAARAAATPPVAVTPVNAVSARAVLWRGAGVFRITVIVKATFALTHNGIARWIAAAPIVEADRVRPGGLPGELAEASEIAPYVPTAAVLLSGCAHAPHGRTTAAMTVRLAVYREKALVDKQIHVFGDRDSPSSTPRPFATLPILSALPNFVDPRNPRRPSSFGPIAPTSPGRLRLLGNVDPATLDATVPKLVGGFDCQFFNAAPADQQTAFLQGDEWIVLDGLHPKLARVQTRLPSAVGKARLNLGTPNGPGPSREVGLVADTLVIDAEKMVCSMIWRGHVLLNPEEAASSMQVFAGLELPGQPIAWPEPRSPSWSESALGDTGPVRVLSAMSVSADPADATGPVDTRMFRRAVLPFVGPEPVKPLGESQSGAETEAVDIRMFRRAIMPFKGAAEPTPVVVEPEQTPMPPIERLELFADAPIAAAVDVPPAYVPSMQVPPPMLGVPRGSGSSSVPPPPVYLVSPPAPVAAATPIDVVPVPPEAEPTPAAAIALPLPAEAPVKASAAEVVANLRQEILARLSAGASLQGLALAGADLQDFDFNGASLAGLDFTRANLRRAHLVGVQAAEILLDGADLTEANFARADLTRAKLTRAVVTKGSFEGANLTGADLQRMSGDAPSFRTAKLQGADLRQATLPGACFDEAVMCKAQVAKSDLSGSRFVRADLSSANLRDCKLCEADFTRANLEGAELRDADVSRARLDGEARKTAKLTPPQVKSLGENKP